LLSTAFTNVSQSLTTLIASKQSYANVVVAERKSTWEKIVDRNVGDLTEYQATVEANQTDSKNRWDSGVKSSAGIIQQTEQKKRKERLANEKL